MSKSSWEIYKGLKDLDNKPSLVEPHDEIKRILEDDSKYCPPWRNFRSRYEAISPKTSKDLPVAPAESDERGDSFLPTPEMVKMVNVALYLRRPLLITGNPGTGKSTLIYSVARELQLGKVLRWPITSRSSLQRSLYEYDAIGRLQDWQLKEMRRKQLSNDGTSEDSAAKQGKANASLDLTAPEDTDIGEYLRLGPLGSALLPWDRPRALLIDEIDKCDVDLPNDLLNIFEEGYFEIPELVRLRRSKSTVKVRPADSEEEREIVGGRVQCLHFPFVIMTSNNERDFPPAFLRRCIQLKILDPKKEDLWRIVKSHLGKETTALKEAEEIIEEFLKKVLNKKDLLATDQLLNAIFLLTRGGIPHDETQRHDLRNNILRSLNQ